MSHPPSDPSPGQVVILPWLGDTPEQWLVIEVDSERTCLVPADLSPLVGSGDVPVDAASPMGAMTLRGRHAVRTSSAFLRRATQVGQIERQDLDRIRRRVGALRHGTRVGSIREQDNDLDPDYRRLDAALAEAAKRLEIEDRERSSHAARWRWIPGGRLFERRGQLAAALAGLVIGSLLIGWWGRGLVLPGHPPEHEGASPGLEQLDVAWLRPGALRGDEGEALRLHPDQPDLFVMLTLPPHLGAGTHRVTVRRRSAPPAEVHAIDVSLGAAAHLALRLPPLEPGVYELELSSTGDAPAPSERYLLQVLPARSETTSD